MRNRIPLNEHLWEIAWEREPGQGPDWTRSVPARVPGNLATDLARAGILPDPYGAENFRACAWAAEVPFWYRAHLNDAELKALLENPEGKAQIVFEGLDTFCEAFINGRGLGKTHNMFRVHRLNLNKEWLKRDGSEELVVRIDPVLAATREWMAELGIDLEGRNAAFGIKERLAARKMQMAFGWDNCPHLLAGGICGPVFLEIQSGPVFSDITWHIESLDPEKSSARVVFTGGIAPDFPSAVVRVHGICGDSAFDGQTAIQSDASWTISVAVHDARLWWPNGHGLPNLYDVRLSLESEDGTEMDETSLWVALRDVRVRTGPPERRLVDFDLVGSVPGKRSMDGGMTGPWSRMPLPEPHEVEVRPFEFIVNGRLIFIKGANWQHPEALTGAATDEQYERLLRHAHASNMNMIRIWGGGCIEADIFYDTCARLGLMVWQDFFFACGQFPGDNPAFLEEIKGEAEDIVKRLRNHPAIVCWCGDNESDMNNHDKGLRPEDNPINRGVIPDALKRYDLQQRYYHPSSPSGGAHPRSEWGGDRRDWGSWYPEGNYRHIRQDEGRFISEGGSYALPSRQTVERFVPKDLQWPIDNLTWRLHTGDLDFAERRFDRRNEACVSVFGQPRDLDDLIRLSQFAQAWGYKLLIEHCRRRKGECGGVLLWKLNDAWPAVDAGLIDHALRPRMALRFVAEAFRSVAVSIKEPLEDKDSPLEVWGVNDTPEAVTGDLLIEQMAIDSDSGMIKTVGEGKHAVRMAPMSASCLMHLDRTGCDPETTIWKISFQSPSGTIQASSTYTLSPRTAWHYWNSRRPRTNPSRKMQDLTQI